MKRLFGGAGAALGVKLLTGIAVAASAAVVAGAATEVALTGSVNPANWGQNVTQAVQTCKDTLRASGTRGIGPCVSAIAKQHGEQVSDSKSSKARENGKDHGKSSKARENGKDNGKDNGKGNPKDKGGIGNGNGNSHKPSGTGNPGTSSESSLLIVW